MLALMRPGEASVGSREVSPLDIAGREMRSGEKLIWAERPIASVHARREKLTALFGVFFFGFSAFWTYTAANQGSFALVGVPLVVMGLLTVLSPAWAYIRGKRTVYAISNQRLLILISFPRYRVASFGPHQIQRVERTERPDGSGDIVIHRETLQSGDVNRVRETGFFGIREVRRIEKEVLKLSEQRD